VTTESANLATYGTVGSINFNSIVFEACTTAVILDLQTFTIFTQLEG
jgi:hypothetical protein